MDSLIRPPMKPEEFRDPRWARFLFFGTAAAWLWLVVRLYMASVFLPSGWGKVTGGEWLFGTGEPVRQPTQLRAGVRIHPGGQPPQFGVHLPDGLRTRGAGRLGLAQPQPPVHLVADP